MDYVNEQSVGGYEAIAEAIIAQAGRDYLEYKKILYMNPKDKEASYGLAEVTRFFNSKYFETISDVDPKWLIERLDAEIESWKKSEQEKSVTEQEGA